MGAVGSAVGSLEWPGTFGRVLLGCVFLASAGGKLRGRAVLAAYLDGVAALRLVPPSWAHAAGAGALVAECAVVLLLPWNGTARAGLWLATGLLAVLTWAVARTVRRGIVASCRCFGGAAKPFGRRHVVRNAVLLAAALAALPRPDALPSGGPALLAVGAGVAGAAVVVTLDDLVELFAPAGTPTTGTANAEHWEI
ncbi:MauE/DoxX family redox-associated membrane protein [Kitasatospora phosalacinea]|uniref:MauE/DoxX family redox-associated membrane protein n=1 Tax=Kitasatospora phosalacinea TaxID=2065 RepID=UPI00255786A4|nr:MauE/DoxX family redox-associated membrane protein [Kitasatospora phosalacinea]